MTCADGSDEKSAVPLSLPSCCVSSGLASPRLTVGSTWARDVRVGCVGLKHTARPRGPCSLALSPRHLPTGWQGLGTARRIDGSAATQGLLPGACDLEWNRSLSASRGRIRLRNIKDLCRCLRIAGSCYLSRFALTELHACVQGLGLSQLVGRRTLAILYYFYGWLNRS